MPNPRDIDKNFGLTPPFGLRHLVQFYDNAEKAKDIIVNKWCFPGTNAQNWLIVDSNDNGYIFELTADLNAYRKAGDFGRMIGLLLKIPLSYMRILPSECFLTL